MQNINITPIFQVIISIVVALISRYLVPYLRNKFTVEEMEKTLAIIDTVVAAAEQIGKTLGYDGEAKKAYVVNRLLEMGFALDDTLNEYIEAAVLTLHNELVK